jgi:hypothetical protein
MLEQETSKLRSWLGDRGSARPPQDKIVEALYAFQRDQHVETRRQTLLVCFGCTESVLEGGSRLIEDGERFPKLLEAVNAYILYPRAFRSCYRGLLNTYFSYDPADARSAGKQNWEKLRTYLRNHIENTIAPGILPAWVSALQTHADLLEDDPGSVYGEALLSGRSEEFEEARKALEIHENSWLIWRLVLGTIEAAARKEDALFRRLLPDLLNLLTKHPLATNHGLAKLLTRYQVSEAPVVHTDLRDFAVGHWGNPWLALNSAKWSLVAAETRQMVSGWLKLILIQRFFNLLAADGTNDTRRLRFWERYHDSIDDMYFALGNTARRHRGPDFQDIRKQMAGRLLHLYGAGSPDNNAFIMCMGKFVVVEFGLFGNACFIFRRDTLPYKLEGDIAGNRSALKHDSAVERLLHKDGHGRWEHNFQQALASLMQVQPLLDVQSRIRPKTQTGTIGDAFRNSHSAGMSDVPQAPFVGPPRRQEFRSANTASFSNQELSWLCDTRRIRVEDYRDRNGNLWVRTDDKDRYVSDQLRSWGFSFKEGKGWWRK